MSAADDALREMAANRGCRLVSSRIRTPGRGDYGRFGLKDAKTGKAVLGFGKKGLTATAEEVEAFLRGGGASAWQELGRQDAGAGRDRNEAETRRRRQSRSPNRSSSSATPARRTPTTLAALIVALGYEVDRGRPAQAPGRS